MRQIEMGVIGEDGQRGRFIRLVLDARRDDAAELLGEIRIIVAALNLAVDAVIDRLAGLVADIEADIAVTVGVDARFKIADALAGRALADIVDDAARVGPSVERRGRAFQHFDAFEPETVDEKAAEAIAEILQPVEIGAAGGGVETANVDPVRTVVDTEGLGEDASGIAKRFVDLLRARRVHLIAADDRYGLRNLFDGHGILGAGGGRLGHETLDRGNAVALFIRLAIGLHDDGIELDRRTGILRMRRKGGKRAAAGK